MPLERWIWTLIWWNTQHINGEEGLEKTINQISNFCQKKSRNGDTLGPVELILWLDQGNQGDRREQDDQGEV